MANDAYLKYLEGEVLAADPVKLIRFMTARLTRWRRPAVISFPVISGDGAEQ